MKTCLLVLVFLMLFVPYNAQAESVSGNTDQFSTLNKSHGMSKKEEQQEIDRVHHLQDIPGLEWLQMAMDEKQDQILASMYVLNQYGVTLHKSPNYYYNLIEEKLSANPNLYNTNLTDILSTIVYEKEPETREALNRILKKPDIKKIEAH